MDKLDIATEALMFLSDADRGLIIKIDDDGNIQQRAFGDINYLEYIGALESCKHDFIDLAGGKDADK